MSYNKGNNASIPEELRAGLGSILIWKRYTTKRKESGRMKNLLYPSTYTTRQPTCSVSGSSEGLMDHSWNISRHWIKDGWNDLFQEYKKTNASLYEEEKSCVEPEYPEPPEESAEEQDDFTVSIEKPSWSVELEPYTEPYHETENKGEYSLADLGDMDFPEQRFLAKDIILLGTTTILAGRPKKGK